MKVVYVTFNKEMMCFAHALFNAIDSYNKGNDVKIIIEGSSTGLLEKLYNKNNPFNGYFQECLDKNIIEGVCKACAKKMGTLELAEKKGLKLLSDIYGHPSLQNYLDDGYKIITL